ncbi:KilA-N domain-containing protein [Psychrobacter sp. Ps4]|uniref:KilA-N domain-containing protein n=1 Tax=Psychrobacter sp. Ps4 TaxID=2790958 RepID=UPI001EE02CC1|nr:KilA-N domain-containing protein [Psychrobacter sp. Ps4]MCG3810066.1 KilA-N domain-containing protein [Psychrobacter sp. Ps4]
MLTISNSNIDMKDGLYSLNDLHRASGSNKKHQASNFMRLEATKGLIYEIERSSDVSNGTNSVAYKVIQGGESQQQGTFVCRELVYSYAMWISPRFQLMVIRAFDSIANQQQQLSQRLNGLCRDLSMVDAGLTIAGRFLCVGGKQIKPQLQQDIDSTLKQMQPSLNLVGGTDSEK